MLNCESGICVCWMLFESCYVQRPEVTWRLWLSKWEREAWGQWRSGFPGPCGGFWVKPETWGWLRLSLALLFLLSFWELLRFLPPNTPWFMRLCLAISQRGRDTLIENGLCRQGLYHWLHSDIHVAVAPAVLSLSNACLSEIACSAHDKDMFNLKGYLSL